MSSPALRFCYSAREEEYYDDPNREEREMQQGQTQAAVNGNTTAWNPENQPNTDDQEGGKSTLQASPSEVGEVV